MSLTKKPTPARRFIATLLIAQFILAALPVRAQASPYQEITQAEDDATKSEDEGLGSLEDVLNRISAWRKLQRKMIRSQKVAKNLDSLTDEEWRATYGESFEKARQALTDALGPEAAADAELQQLAHNVARSTYGTLPDATVMTRLRYWGNRLRSWGGKDPTTYNETIGRILSDYMQSPERRDSIAILLSYVARDMGEPLIQEANGTPIWQSAMYGTMVAFVLVSALHFHAVRVKNPETGEVSLRNWRNWGDRFKSDGKTIASFLRQAKRSAPEMIKELGTVAETGRWSLLEIPQNLWQKAKFATLELITRRNKAAVETAESGLKRAADELEELKNQYANTKANLDGPQVALTYKARQELEQKLEDLAKQVVDKTTRLNSRQVVVDRIRRIYETSLVMPMSQGQAELAYKMAQARFNTAKADLENLRKTVKAGQVTTAIQDAELALAEAELAYKNAKEMTSMWSVIKREALNAKNAIKSTALAPFQAVGDAAQSKDMQALVSVQRENGLIPTLEQVVENATGDPQQAALALRSIDQKVRSYARGAKSVTVDELINKPSSWFSVRIATFLQVAAGTMIAGGVPGLMWGYNENFVKPQLINPLTALRFIQGMVIGDLEIRIDQFRAKFMKRYDFLDPYMYAQASSVNSDAKLRMDIEKQTLLEDKAKYRQEFIDFTQEFDKRYDEFEVLAQDASFYGGAGIGLNRLNQGLSQEEKDRLKSVSISEEMDPGKFKNRDIDRVIQLRDELMARNFIASTDGLREIVGSEWKKIVEMRGVGQCAKAKDSIAVELSLVREPNANALCLKGGGLSTQEAEAIRYSLALPNVACGPSAATFCSNEANAVLYLGGDQSVHDCFRKVLCDGVRRDHGEALDRMVVSLGPLKTTLDSTYKIMHGLTIVMRELVDLPQPPKHKLEDYERELERFAPQ